MSPTIEEIRAESVAGRMIAQAMNAGGFDQTVYDKAQICLLDYFSCALEARDLPWAKQAASLATKQSSGAALIGREGFASPHDAGFANGVAGHGLVREDMHTGAIAHLGVVIWPAVLAVAAREKISGQDLLDAAITGYEVGARLGRAIMTTELARLFRPTGLIGAAASSVAISRLYGLTADQALSAFALAINASGGLNQWPHTGGSEMYFHPGFAVRNGISCTDLARAGAVASHTILEGEAGFFKAYARQSFDGEIDLFPDGQVEIMTVFNKQVPACNFAQTPCQAAILANAKTSGRQVTGIHIEASEAAVRYPGCDAKDGFNYALQAKMSILFGVAAAIARNEITEENYSRLEDAEIHRLIEASTLVENPEYTSAFPARQGATVTLTLEDGETVSASLEDVVAADAGEIRSRFSKIAINTLGAERTNAIIATIDNLRNEPLAERLDSLSALPEHSNLAKEITR
ncbi:MAG: hypothetical protein COB78_13195 [Hyphomicrobiales bacterium]|nr:MAG: hypothetical protein COB78_13195 [Hyphomicrobiales bacterium]